MKCVVQLLLWCMLCSSCSKGSEGNPLPDGEIKNISVSVNHPELQYRGRFKIEGDGASFSTPGSSVKIGFDGTGLKAGISAENFGGDGYSYLYVFVDGDNSLENRKIIKIGKHRTMYQVVEGLDAGSHTVELVKKNECWGIVHLHGFELHGKEVLPLEAKKSRLIEFFGDSNPSGWSAWDDKDKGGDDTSEGYFAYPGFTARALGAEWSNLSIGGFGITDRMGDKDLTDFYNKIHVFDKTTSNNIWDFDQNNLGKKPDVVVINLGANDYWHGASKTEIKQAWHRFVSVLLRPVYPSAHIVLANSIGWAMNEPADYLPEVIKEFQAKGDNNISYVKFPWLWGQEHAVIPEHAGFANILGKHIAERMDWGFTPVAYSSFPEKDGGLGNSSFEKAIMGKRPDGWRPTSIASSALYMESGQAKDGKAFVRCFGSQGVHQAVIAKKGDKFTIKAWAKSIKDEKGILQYRFRNQAQKALASGQKELQVGSGWKQFELETEIAPEGTWQVDIVLKATGGSTIDFDLIETTSKN